MLDDIGGALGCGLILLAIVLVVAAGWAIAFGIVVAPTYTLLALYAGLKFLAANGFVALDELFYPGFEVSPAIVWAFWGLVGGIAIQGCREMRSHGRKGMGGLAALAPILLLGLNGIIKDINVPTALGTKTTTVEQNTPISEIETIKQTEPTPTTTKQTTTGSERKSAVTPEPVDINATRAAGSLFPTKRGEPGHVTRKQNTVTTPTTVPKPSTPSVPLGMVLIPAGEFQMGSNDSTDEKPVHTVYTDAFYMDKHEVTNAQYKTFVNANPQWRKDRIPGTYHDGDYLKHWNSNNYPSEKGNHPVTYVSWYGAMAYAEWTNKRLPTEAEWEKAARGGLTGKKYPWGNTIDSSKANYDKSVGDTMFVGKYPANGYGLCDMAGNVLEWCLDRYDEDFYTRSLRQNPIVGGNISDMTTNFSTVTTNRVLRGGSWSTLPQSVRVADRTKGNPTFSYYDVGFRCVRAAPLNPYTAKQQ